MMSATTVQRSCAAWPEGSSTSFGNAEPSVRDCSTSYANACLFRAKAGRPEGDDPLAMLRREIVHIAMTWMISGYDGLLRHWTAGPANSPSWLVALYRHAQEGKNVAATDVLFDEVHKYLDADDFEGLNSALWHVDVERLNTVTITAFLALTRPYDAHLPNRAYFLQRARTRLSSLVGPERTDQLVEPLA